MFDQIEPYLYTIAVLICIFIIALSQSLIWKNSVHKLNRKYQTQLKEERERSRNLCLSTVECLSYALEASDPYNIGYLNSVQQISMALAKKLRLTDDEKQALYIAALLHNIGRLGVPDQILYKKDELTPEELVKMRSHAILGTRILAPIPFPWDILPIVRHHIERWDGSGYPDSLKGTMIPIASRVLAIASSYSAMLQPRPFRGGLSQEDAISLISRGCGTQYDPEIVEAFKECLIEISTIASPTSSSLTALSSHANQDAKATTREETKAALDHIASAQRETRGLYSLSNAIAGSMNLEAVAEALVRCTMETVTCDACALFLPVENCEYLQAEEAQGVNARQLLGSQAKIGTYITGRAFSRGEMIRSGFIRNDVTIRQVSDPWRELKTILAVPLMVNCEAVGTLNLYSKEPDVFGDDTQRIAREIAMQASRVVDSARRYGEVHERAYTDTLTGLRNVRFLRDFLETEINRSDREDIPMAVLYIDLDNFKPINDRFGHARGDQTLKEVAEILKAHVRNYDLAARYAGDEFVIVLSRAGRITAEIVAMKLKSAVERHGHRLIAKEQNFPQIGISVGIVNYPEDGKDLASLLCSSDAAMFADKSRRNAGRTAA